MSQVEYSRPTQQTYLPSQPLPEGASGGRPQFKAHSVQHHTKSPFPPWRVCPTLFQLSKVMLH